METVKRGLDKFFKWLNLVFQVAASAALVFMVVTCALQVASRYISFVKILGMEELARMGFVWMVSLALSLCVAYKSHLRIDILSNRVPERAKPFYDILLDLLILVYLVLLFRYSVVKCAKVGHQVTIVFLIEMKWLYSALIVGSGGAILNTLHEIFGNICAIAGVGRNGEAAQA
ncbi:hypothetical protein CE91St41_33440 [Oscillospiraceae bacterium]|nr:hypothetical protein CE91St40_33430 [Oscillospiraceae bacterium]BDF76455.1 hypothetical protein CE91St41_33440 [Oscillospiraceae bacterium]